MKQKQEHPTNFLFEQIHIVIYYGAALNASDLFASFQLYIR